MPSVYAEERCWPPMDNPSFGDHEPIKRDMLLISRVCALYCCAILLSSHVDGREAVARCNHLVALYL